MYNGFVNVNRNAGIISSEVTATRALLGCSVAAGPLFLLTLVIQILVRPEFHFTRSEPTVLSIGHWVGFRSLTSQPGLIGHRAIQHDVSASIVLSPRPPKLFMVSPC
jgi:hypothetical protein